MLVSAARGFGAMLHPRVGRRCHHVLSCGWTRRVPARRRSWTTSAGAA